MTNPTDYARDIASRVSGEEMWRHLEIISAWNKHAGTPGELQTMEYLRAVLDGYGYDTELTHHPAYISLPVSAKVVDGDTQLRALAVSFSTSTPEPGVTGPAVYVGRGNAEDYAGKQVEGAIVLIDGVPGPGQTIEAGRRGVAAQVHVSPHEYLHEMCVSSVWGSPGDDEIDRLPRNPVLSITAEDGAGIKHRLARGEAVTLTVHTEVDTGWRRTPILSAELPSLGASGADAASEPFVMFSGHVDTWHLGAMDNGGANVTMLEVARLAAKQRDAWQRGLRLLFWSGHSQGRYSSSSWYADANWRELEERAVAHVNIDSTGGRGNTVVADATAAVEFAEIASEALELHAQQEWAGRRMHRAGDQSFWGIGVPAIFANMSEQPIDPSLLNAQAAVFAGGARKGNGTGWWWHTPEDTLDKMDRNILERDTKIYMHAVWRLLSDEVLPINLEAAAESVRSRIIELADIAGDRLELRDAVEAVNALTEAVSEVLSPALGLSAAERNERIVRLSRELTRIEYSAGDRFRHDPALFVGGVPSLDDVARLAGLDPETPEYWFLQTRLVRDRNRVTQRLHGALEVANRFGVEVGAEAVAR